MSFDFPYTSTIPLYGLMSSGIVGNKTKCSLLEGLERRVEMTSRVS